VTDPDVLTLADVQAALPLVREAARVTPVVSARWLREQVGGAVFFKCENLQRAGSFKIRGAYTRLSRLTPDERAAGVVAGSAGNHAQGVALAAQMLGIEATVFMPHGAPIPKVLATQGYGAAVRFHGSSVDDCVIASREFSEETGAIFVHPFDHRDIVAGQGTLGLEVLDQVPDVRTLVVSTGGGGLLAGSALAVKALAPHVRVVGVQAAGAAAYPGSLAAGHPVRLTAAATMADGIAVMRPGDIPFALVQRDVDEIRLVGEEAISRALLLCLERSKLVVEPAGVASVAAVLDDPTAFEPPVVCVLTGGNVDPLLLLRIIRFGMTSAGRFLAVRLVIHDSPGSLAALLTELGAADANVVEVEHVRTNERLRVHEVEVAVHLETRGPTHCAQLLDRLRARGYQPHVDV
jgi:threonine dehydratase